MEEEAGKWEWEWEGSNSGRIPVSLKDLLPSVGTRSKLLSIDNVSVYRPRLATANVLWRKKRKKKRKKNRKQTM